MLFFSSSQTALVTMLYPIHVASRRQNMGQERQFGTLNETELLDEPTIPGTTLNMPEK